MYHLAVSRQQHGDRMVVAEEGVVRYRTARTVGQERHRITGGGTDRQAFRPIADNHLIDFARRIERQVDDAHRADLAVRDAGIAVMIDQRKLAVRGDLNVVRKDAGEHVVAFVGDSRAVDVEQRDPIRQRLSHQRALAVGRNGYCGGLLRRSVGGRHRDGADDGDSLPGNRQDADAVVGAVGDPAPDFPRD